MQRKYILEAITKIVGDVDKAEAILDLLSEEGVLHIGYGNADIDIVVKKFTDTFGTTKVSKYDRYATGRLVNKYGSQSIVGIIQMLADHSTEKYAPVVGSLRQLEEKIVSVLNFLRSTKDKEDIEI
jgi:hypothetical protein